MLQEIFRIPGLDLPIFGYGLMMVIGFLVAVQLAKFLSKRSGIDPEIFVNAAMIALVAGVIGSRLSHVLENWSSFTPPGRPWYRDLLDMINLRSGGLTFYGGLMLAAPIVMLYGWYKKVPLRLGMDIAAPCIMLGLAFGRVGCLLNGCCYGAECNLPWAVRFPYYSNAYIDQYERGDITPPEELFRKDESGRELLVRREVAMRDPTLRPIAKGQRSLDVHPAQLYSAFNALLITATLLAFFTIPHGAGQVFALMLILKGITRFVLEMLRVEPAVIGRGTDVLSFLPPLSISMVISVGLLAAGIALWLLFRPRQIEATGAAVAMA